jgi:hypothetical protein
VRFPAVLSSEQPQCSGNVRFRAGHRGIRAIDDAGTISEDFWQP